MIGFDQPIDQTIAYIRYVPCEEKTDRMLLYAGNNQYFRKLSSLNDQYDWTRNNHPDFLYSSPNYDLQFLSLPNIQIKHHLLPENKKSLLEQDLKYTSISPDFEALKKDAVDFCKLLAKSAKIPQQYFGITGSLLGGLVTPASDLDITVYGFYNSLKVRDILRTIFESGDPHSELRRYNLGEFKTLFIKRTQGSQLQFYDFIKYESRKLHQGKFRNRDFFIRFMEFPTREEYAVVNHFLKEQIRILGRIRIAGEVRGDEFWWTTPARIDPANVRIIKSDLTIKGRQMLESHALDQQQIRQTFTLRGRFIENVRLLEQFIAEGTLELVIPEGTLPYLQLALGSDSRDFLIQN